MDLKEIGCEDVNWIKAVPVAGFCRGGNESLGPKKKVERFRTGDIVMYSGRRR
jgi:hypothetical protein